MDSPFYAEKKSPVKRAAVITAERALRLVEAGPVRADSCRGAGSERLDAFMERLPAQQFTLAVATATWKAVRATVTMKSSRTRPMLTIPAFQNLVNCEATMTLDEVKEFLEQMLMELRVTPEDVKGKARSVADLEYLFVQLAAGGLFGHAFTYAENRQKLMREIPLLSVLREECYGEGFPPATHLVLALSKVAVVPKWLGTVTEEAPEIRKTRAAFVAAMGLEEVLRRAAHPNATAEDWKGRRVNRSKDFVTEVKKFRTFLAEDPEHNELEDSVEEEEEERGGDDMSQGDLWGKPNKRPKTAEGEGTKNQGTEDSALTEHLNGVPTEVMVADGTQHAQWRGLRVVFVEPGTADPVGGRIVGSKVVGGGQAMFHLELQGGAKLWVDARQAAAAVVCRALDDRDRREKGLPSEGELVDLATTEKANTAKSKGRMDIKDGYAKLTKAQVTELDKWVPDMDELYLQSEKEKTSLAGIFTCPHGEWVVGVRRALAREKKDSGRTVIEGSVYFEDVFGEGMTESLMKSHNFVCDMELALWAAYAVPGKIKSFSRFVASAEDTDVQDYGADPESDDEGFVFTVDGLQPKKSKKDRRLTATLDTPELVREAVEIWVAILRRAHGDGILAKTRVLTDTLQAMKVRSAGGVRAMLEVVRRAYSGFQKSLDRCCTIANKVSSSAPHGYVFHDVVAKHLELLPEGFMESTGDSIALVEERKSLRQSLVTMTKAQRELRAEMSSLKAKESGSKRKPTNSMQTPQKKKPKQRPTQTPQKKKPRRTTEDTPDPAPAPAPSSARGSGGGVGVSRKLRDALGPSKVKKLEQRLEAQGHDTVMDMVREFSAKQEGPRHCFWHESPLGKELGGCPYGTECKYDHG